MVQMSLLSKFDVVGGLLSAAENPRVQAGGLDKPSWQRDYMLTAGHGRFLGGMASRDTRSMGRPGHSPVRGCLSSP